MHKTALLGLSFAFFRLLRLVSRRYITLHESWVSDWSQFFRSWAAWKTISCNLCQTRWYFERINLMCRNSFFCWYMQPMTVHATAAFFPSHCTPTYCTYVRRRMHICIFSPPEKIPVQCRRKFCQREERFELRSLPGRICIKFKCGSTARRSKRNATRRRYKFERPIFWVAKKF